MSCIGDLSPRISAKTTFGNILRQDHMKVSFQNTHMQYLEKKKTRKIATKSNADSVTLIEYCIFSGSLPEEEH